MKRFGPASLLLLLSLLWAADSLRSDLFPAAAGRPPLAGEAVLLASLAVLAAIAASLRKTPWPTTALMAQAILVSLGLFVLPSLLIEFAKSRVSDYTRIALLSITPLLTTILDPHIGANEPAERPGAFAATLIGITGSLLVFPMEIPASPAAFLAFCAVLSASASIAAANSLAVRNCRQNGVPVLTYAAVIAGFAACCLGLPAFVLEKGKFAPIDAWSAPDLLALILLFWLMKHMSAVRMSTRFLIAPLLANLVGLALLRPRVPWQSLLGLQLIALASTWLLFAPEKEPEANHTLLRTD